MSRGIRLALIALALSSITEANLYQQDVHPFGKLKVSQFDKEAKATYDEYRLPDSLSPYFQDITIQPEFDVQIIYGTTTIYFTCDIATPNITLNAADVISILDGYVAVTDLDDSSDVHVESFRDNDQYNFGKWTAFLAQPLEATKNYSIKIDFSSTLNYFRDCYGPYIYGGNTLDNRYSYMATCNRPNHARKIFPCFDEPAMKAVFRTTIIREDHQMSRSNMPAASSRKDLGMRGYTTDSFQDSPVMSSYQNSFLVSSFATATLDRYEVNAPSDIIGNSDYALATAKTSIEYFESYFDEVYPLPKIAFNALESSFFTNDYGLNNFMDMYLLYNASMTTPDLMQVICELIGNAAAHNWFGNSVTLTWWDYIWTQEALAGFYGYKGCAAASPDMLGEVNFVSTIMQSALNEDATSDSHALLFYTQDIYDWEKKIFDAITYKKGPAVARSMEFILTESTMQTAMINYLKRYRYQNTNDDDFYAEMDSQAVADGWSNSFTFSEAMRNFTDQKNFPLLTVSRDAVTGDATITQSVYLGRNEPLPNEDYRWYVPITTHTSVDDPAAAMIIRTWIPPTADSAVVSGPPIGSYFIVNKFYAVFCRVNYDAAGWSDNINGLETDTFNIPVENRIQLMADAFTFAEDGILDYGIAFATTNYLKFETIYSALIYGMNRNFKVDMLLRSNATIEPMLSAQLIALMEPSYLRVGFRDSLSDPYGDQRVRSLSTGWLCHLSHAQCLQDTNNLFNVWLTNTSDYTLMTPNMKRSVQCSGASQGNIATAIALLDHYKENDDENERDDMLYALSCLRDTAAINFYLDELFRIGNYSYSFTYGSIFGAISYISVNPVAEGVTWTYMKLKYQDIIDSIGSYDAEKCVANLVQYFSTQERLIELLYMSNIYYFDTPDIEEAIIRVQKNILFNVAHGDSIYNYLLGLQSS